MCNKCAGYVSTVDLLKERIKELEVQVRRLERSVKRTKKERAMAKNCIADRIHANKVSARLNNYTKNPAIKGGNDW